MCRGIVMMQKPILSLPQIVYFSSNCITKTPKNCKIRLLTDSCTIENELEIYETLDIEELFKHYFPLWSVGMEPFFPWCARRFPRWKLPLWPRVVKETPFLVTCDNSEHESWILFHPVKSVRLERRPHTTHTRQRSCLQPKYGYLLTLLVHRASCRNCPTPWIPFLNVHNYSREKLMKFIFSIYCHRGTFHP